MNKITLVSPYFGNKFPSTFTTLLNSMKFNSDVSFIIPTNLDSTNLSITSDNITFVKTDLHLLNKKIDIILGYHAKINSPYKLVVGLE